MNVKLKLIILSLGFVFANFSLTLTAQDIEGYDKMTKDLLSETVPLITVDSLNTLDLTNVYLLDTREEEEFEVSHIPGSRYVGYNWFKKKYIRDIPKDACVVTYCSVGYRSEKIGERLLRDGFTNVYNLQGGIFSWVNNDGELINNDNEIIDEVHGYDKDWSQWINTNKCKVELD